MELQIVEQNKLVVAMQSPMIRNSDDKGITDALGKAVVKAFQDTGQRIDEADQTYLKSALLTEARRYPNLRIEEIPVAIERGVRREYGDYFGINVVSISGFFRGYLASQERSEAAKELNKLALPEPTKPTESAIRAMETEMIVNAYDKFRNDGYYLDFGNHVYRKLDERGLITFTPERKREFMEMAKKSVEAKNNPATALTREDRAKRQSVIERLANAIKTADPLIVREAKQIALTEYFTGLKEMDIEIKQLLEETKNG